MKKIKKKKYENKHEKKSYSVRFIGFYYDQNWLKHIQYTKAFAYIRWLKHFYSSVTENMQKKM